MYGEGWKTGIGATLLTMSGANALRSIKTENPIATLLGSAVLGGLGGTLVALDKRKKGKGLGLSGGALLDHSKIFDKHFQQKFKELLKNNNSLNFCWKCISKLIEEHKDKLIHAKDILGDNWKQKGQEIMNKINSVNHDLTEKVNSKVNKIRGGSFKSFINTFTVTLIYKIKTS